MRATTSILFLFLLLAACRAEPGFDERYDAANQEIEARADAIDAQLEQSGAANDGVGSSPPTAKATHAAQPED